MEPFALSAVLTLNSERFCMVKFGSLLVLVAIAVVLTVLAGGSGFLAVALLAGLVGMFAIAITFVNEIRRVLH
jgi:Na+/melibiose symporter-like transporter